jgi:flagellar motor switch protein FliG
MDGIAAAKPLLADAIQAQLWTFEDLCRLDTPDFEVLLRSVSSVDLELALRKSSDTLKARIFKAMSSRRVEQIKDNLASAKPAPIAKIEEAQNRIATLAAELITNGKLRDPNEKAI